MKSLTAIVIAACLVVSGCAMSKPEVIREVDSASQQIVTPAIIAGVFGFNILTATGYGLIGYLGCKGISYAVKEAMKDEAVTKEVRE